jgi:uncharacterized MAPEG superfamily protein
MQVYLELKLLVAAAVLGLIQLLIAAAAARRQQSLAWAAGARDEPMPITGVAARLDRAFRNFMETFGFFAVAVIVAYLGGKIGNPLVLWGEVAYLVTRVVYVPLYAAGVPRVRTLAWAVSIVGIGMIVWAVLT